MFRGGFSALLKGTSAVIQEVNQPLVNSHSTSTLLLVAGLDLTTLGSPKQPLYRPSCSRHVSGGSSSGCVSEPGMQCDRDEPLLQGSVHVSNGIFNLTYCTWNHIPSDCATSCYRSSRARARCRLCICTNCILITNYRRWCHFYGSNTEQGAHFNAS